MRLTYLKHSGVNLDKVAAFPTSRCYSLTCTSYLPEIFSESSSDVSGKSIFLLLMTDCFVEKQIWRKEIHTWNWGSELTFIIVEHSENIQIRFLYTEVYSLFFSCGLMPQGVKETEVISDYLLVPVFLHVYLWFWRAGFFHSLSTLHVVFFDMHSVTKNFSRHFLLLCGLGL